MRATFVLVTFVIVAATPSAFAQQYETGCLNRTAEGDEATYPYQVYLAADYDPEVRWPVTLSLHGAGERGSDGLLRTEVGLGTALRRHADRYPAIVAFPQAPKNTRRVGGTPRSGVSCAR